MFSYWWSIEGAGRMIKVCLCRCKRIVVHFCVFFPFFFLTISSVSTTNYPRVPNVYSICRRQKKSPVQSDRFKILNYLFYNASYTLQGATIRLARASWPTTHSNRFGIFDKSFFTPMISHAHCTQTDSLVPHSESEK